VSLYRLPQHRQSHRRRSSLDARQSRRIGASSEKSIKHRA
jgi:hypothetical protein